MILFPPAKINLGLNILSKRSDGYHEIETCMYPIPFTDILEITASDSFEFVQSGLDIPCKPGSNLCEQAFILLKDLYGIPNVRIHLRKQIPMGAGLGGGSADAAYVLKGLNELFKLTISSSELERLAAQLGSDCPFFIQNKPQIARGRGEILSAINLNLTGKYLILLNPGIHVGTKEAYAGAKPKIPENQLEYFFNSIPLEDWCKGLTNQFEQHIFINHPRIAELKKALYDEGAFYASMSGSGSSVFGLFHEKPIQLTTLLNRNLIYQGFL